jgi:FkbM family methyltransferase
MKLREVFYLLGFIPKPREYAFTVDTFELEKEGRIEFAQWQHPKKPTTVISQQAVDTLREFLSEGDVAIDIGAHAGDTPLPIALATGKSGMTLAFEPNPYPFKILLENARLNAEKINMIPYNYAITEKKGNFVFEYSDPGFCNGGNHQGISFLKHWHVCKLDVSGVNLMDFLKENHPGCIEKITYIKIDTEGYDHAIVASIEELIKARHPYLRTEIYKYTSKKRRIAYFNHLHELGYTLYKVQSEENYRECPVDTRNVMDWDHYDVFAVHSSRMK